MYEKKKKCNFDYDTCKMDTIERFESKKGSNSSIYNLITAKGLKCALLLILLISFVNTLYVLFYKMSENSLNNMISSFSVKLQSINESQSKESQSIKILIFAV